MAKKRIIEKAGKGKLADRAIGPAADEFGKVIAPLGKEAGEVSVQAGRLLLGAVRGSVTGLEKIGNWLAGAIGKRLSKIPAKNITAPNARIAVPAVQALVYSMDEIVIREMYANLLAADMNSETKSLTHPAFVEIIKAMTPLEAKVLEHLRLNPIVEYSVKNPQLNKWQEIAELLEVSIDAGAHGCAVGLSNLQRIGLIEVSGLPHVPIDRDKKLPVASLYKSGRLASLADELKNEIHVNATKWSFEVGPEIRLEVGQFGLYLTPLGQRFVDVCLISA